MTDLRDAAKLALEALEFVLYPQKKQHEAIAALKRALAEDAMDRMAENARELGLDYEPNIQSQIGKDISVEQA